MRYFVKFPGGIIMFVKQNETIAEQSDSREDIECE